MPAVCDSICIFRHTLQLCPNFTLDKLVKQRFFFFFCFKQNFIKIYNFKILLVLNHWKCRTACKKTHAYGWYKEFKDSQEVVVDLLRFGWPLTCKNDSNIHKITMLVLLVSLLNRWTYLKYVHKVVNDILNMKRVAVPKKLSFVIQLCMTFSKCLSLQKRNESHWPSIVFFWYYPVWLFSIPEA